MSTSATLPSDFTPTSTPALRPRRRRRWKRMSPVARYGMIIGALIVGVTAFEFLMHALRAEPRDMRMIAERELTVNTLVPGERVVHVISVAHRSPIDYFRATRGLLVLTDRRLIFLGLRPRDFLAATDAPPTFEHRDFPLDTMVRVTKGRAMLGVARGVVVRTPDETLRLAVASASWAPAQQLVAALTQRGSGLQAEGARQHKLRQQANAEREASLAALRKAQHYVVRRGDAIGSIATRWNVTQDMLRAWNHKTDNTVRVGEVLVVRPADETR